jgi:hypothetical protein
MTVLWGEPDPNRLSDQDLYSYKIGGTEGIKQHTNDSLVQNSWAQLVARGESLHLVYFGYPGGDPDLFYVQSEKGVWSTPLDLTSAFETTATTRDYAPSLAFSPTGERAIAYVSEKSITSSPGEIRVLFFDELGAKGPPVTVIPTAGDGCDSPNAGFDKNGKLHVVATCGKVLNQQIFYATNAEGTWVTTALPKGLLGDNASSMQPALDGVRFHLVFTRLKACLADPTKNCSSTQYRKVGPGTSDELVDLTAKSLKDAFKPSLGVDAEDRVFVALQSYNPARRAEIYVVWSNPDGTFSAPKNLTPGNTITQDMNAGNWVFDAQNLPHLVFERLDMGSDPTNSDIMRAYIDGFDEG